MALKQVQQELKTEGSSRQQVTVHLSGALHSDKRRAFKFVARQLCEHCNGDMKFVSSASVEENEAFLRQVLAHMGRWVTFTVDHRFAAPCHEMLPSIHCCKVTRVLCCRNKQSVVFVLNDMSRFVGEDRSTTLYTLLDLLHTNTGVAVVGLSTTNGVLDLMEKRAKSRFSHHVFIVPSLSATTEDEVCLSIPCDLLHWPSAQASDAV